MGDDGDAAGRVGIYRAIRPARRPREKVSGLVGVHVSATTLKATRRRQQQSAWAQQSYMGYAYEAYSTHPPAGEEGTNDSDAPLGWSGGVNQKVQVCRLRDTAPPADACQWCKSVQGAVSECVLSSLALYGPQ